MPAPLLGNWEDLQAYVDSLEERMVRQEQALRSSAWQIYDLPVTAGLSQIVPVDEERDRGWEMILTGYLQAFAPLDAQPVVVRVGQAGRSPQTSGAQYTCTSHRVYGGGGGTNASDLFEWAPGTNNGFVLCCNNFTNDGGVIAHALLTRHSPLTRVLTWMADHAFNANDGAVNGAALTARTKGKGLLSTDEAITSLELKFTVGQPYYSRFLLRALK